MFRNKYPWLPEMLLNWADVMYSYALSLLGSPADAEDVVMEVTEKMLKQGAKLATMDEGRAVAYLCSAVRNAAITQLRREQRYRGMTTLEELTAADPGPLPEEWLDRRMTLEKVERAFSLLGEGDKDILRMFLLDEMSDEEVAARLGIAPSSARSRLSRARARLRRKMEEMDHAE